MTAQPIQLAVPGEREACLPPISAGELLRWSLTLTAQLVDVSPNTIRDLIRKDEFPPRVHVPGKDGRNGKEQFVPDEVRAWAAGRDWRALVAERLKLEAPNAT
jgi:hypothetical protein